MRTPVPRRHKWKREEDGALDDFVQDYEYHNGPGCEACGASFCMHCECARYAAVLAGTDPLECYNWHPCAKPAITSLGQTFTCPEPTCQRRFAVTAFWSEQG